MNNMKEYPNGYWSDLWFTPAMNKIVPLGIGWEKNGIIYWMAFSIGGKGYMWAYGDMGVYRAPEYDLGKEH